MPWLVWLTVVSAGSGAVGLRATEPAEPVDSPLFRASLKAAFADMAQRDKLASQLKDRSAVALAPGQVIAVDETRWRLMATPAAAGANPRRSPSSPPPAAGIGSVSPQGSTLEATCGTSFCMTACPTCDMTCGETCWGNPTCFDTCYGFTCWATCLGTPTCSGWMCNTLRGATCEGTCGGMTCYGPATCCAHCSVQPVIAEIQVLPGNVVQVKVKSESDLRYTLQVSTNLPSTNWLAAAAAPGTGEDLVLTHTNSAPLSFYRLQTDCQ